MKTLIAVILAGFAFAAQPQIGKKPVEPIAIVVDHLSDQPLSVAVESASLKPFGMTSQLTADYKVAKGSDAASAEMLLVVYHDGYVKGADGWVETSLPGAILRQTVLVLAPGDKALLLVKSVTSPSATLKLKDEDLNSHLQDFIRGKKSESTIAVEPQEKFEDKSWDDEDKSLVDPEASGKTPVPQMTTCQNNAVLAQQICGPRGIASFSCNPSTGAWAFSCQPNRPY